MATKKDLNKKPLFELAHTRVESQRARMEECTRLGICPFCWKNLAKWHDAPIVKRGKFWVITKNDHPYDGARHHYLAIYKDHISSISEIAPKAGGELFSLFSGLCKKNKIKGATILMRFGEMVYTGATVFHLHAQIISGSSMKEISAPKYPDSFITTAIGYKSKS